MKTITTNTDQLIPFSKTTNVIYNALVLHCAHLVHTRLSGHPKFERNFPEMEVLGGLGKSLIQSWGNLFGT